MSNTAYLEASFRIGAQLCRDAIWHNGLCNWTSFQPNPNPSQQRNVYGSHPFDFYRGTAGIAFYLFQLYGFTEDKLVLKTAEAALKNACERYRQLADAGKVSIYLGLGGLALSCEVAARITNSDFWHSKTNEQKMRILEIPANEWGHDMINGPLGLIPYFAGLGNDSQLQDFMDAVGKRILTSAKKQRTGISWNSNEPEQQPLTGYGHGTSGFIHALCELYAYTKDEVYLGAALDAQVYENSCMTPEKDNWLDFRGTPGNTSSQAVQAMNAWCHGAPGIVLSRIRLNEIAPNHESVSDIQTALQTIITQAKLNLSKRQENFSLCHGICGNLEPLLHYDQSFPGENRREFAEKTGTYMYEQFIRHNLPLPSGLFQGEHNHSLMLGDSGSGLFLLQLYDYRNCYSALYITPDRFK
jgi:lantibiotic modifying enzyme